MENHRLPVYLKLKQLLATNKLHSDRHPIFRQKLGFIIPAASIITMGTAGYLSIRHYATFFHGPVV